jgi:orotate phosphoribosyltransferase
MDPQDSPAAAVLGQPVDALSERDDSAPAPGADELLAARLATAPGLVRAGASCWDHARTPIHALSMESAYADPELLRDLGARGARFAQDLGAEIVVGAETAGVPLAASASLSAVLPFAFVRKPGYRGHEINEPPVRGADVAARRVLLVDDAISSGTSVERFTASLAGVGADVVDVFVLVDMRDVAATVSPVASALPTGSVSTYLQVLDLATANNLLDATLKALTVDAITNRWTDDSALGSPACDGRRSFGLLATGRLPVYRSWRARG